MLRFYTPADQKKTFLDLYRIKSVEDYLSKLINRSSRVVFLGVYDLAKEAYFINEYPHKTFLVGDVSTKALSCLERYYPNLQICKTTLDEFDAKPDDLLVINIAEYFLTQEQLQGLVSKGGTVVLNNAHLYIQGWDWIFYSIAQEVRALSLNILATITGQKQWQFRGWWRTIGDFVVCSHDSKKYVKAVIFNNRRARDTVFGRIHSAMIHFESES